VLGDGALHELDHVRGLEGPVSTEDMAFAGVLVEDCELSLSGATRPVRGALAMARLARKFGKRGLLLPAISAEEAALVDGVEVCQVNSLDQAMRFLGGEITLVPLAAAASRLRTQPVPADGGVDFSEIKGQQALRRAVEVAVAGSHNLFTLWPFPPASLPVAFPAWRRSILTSAFRP